MSMWPRKSYEIPVQTAQVAWALFPKGCLAMRIRDVLGEVFNDGQFAGLFAVHQLRGGIACGARGDRHLDLDPAGQDRGGADLPGGSPVDGLARRTAGAARQREAPRMWPSFFDTADPPTQTEVKAMRRRIRCPSGGFLRRVDWRIR